MWLIWSRGPQRVNTCDTLHPLACCVCVKNLQPLKAAGRSCSSRPDLVFSTPAYLSTLRSKSEWRAVPVCGVTVPCVCRSTWRGALAAVSQLVKDRLPQSTVEAPLCSWLLWRWVVLQKSVDSKAWTCLHCSQRYAFTDQLNVSKVSVPSMFTIQDAQLFHDLTPLSVLSDVTSLLSVTFFTGLLASHPELMASQCRLFLFFLSLNHLVCGCGDAFELLQACVWL